MRSIIVADNKKGLSTNTQSSLSNEICEPFVCDTQCISITCNCNAAFSSHAGSPSIKLERVLQPQALLLIVNPCTMHFHHVFVNMFFYPLEQNIY